jgi:peptidoglycan/LPS O-acetylase OafA/YrhL
MEHDMMMMMDMGPEIFGVPFGTLLMLVTGVFYLICAIAIWKPFRQEKNELITALFAFLVYQSISMFFMGVEMWTMNIMYSNIAALAVFIGSAYMLKFPFSKASEKTRKTAFLIIIVIALSLFGWFMMTEARQHALMHFILWYDIVTNGLIVGGSIILFALGSIERSKRAKALTGGAGVVSCCVVSNAAMLGGAMFTSAIFQFLAPVLILTSIRRMQKEKAETQATASSIPASTTN